MTGSGWHVTIPGGPWGCLGKKTADIFYLRVSGNQGFDSGDEHYPAFEFLQEKGQYRYLCTLGHDLAASGDGPIFDCTVVGRL